MTDQDTQLESKRFLQSLRTETHDAHEALEAHPVSRAIAAENITTDGYVRYLQIMERVVQGMEAALEPRLQSHVADIRDRSKASLIASDLEALGAGKNPFPEFNELAGGGDTGHAFGAYYVLEGSALGGRVILKQLPQELRESGDKTRYFEGYGTQTGPMWQRFLGDFGRYVSDSKEEAQAIDGAREAFAAIQAYFNRCHS
jgi:heme oxygenase